MNSVSSTTRKRIEAQGYLGLSDSDLVEVSPWLRLAPAICMVWAGIATYYQSELALMILVPFAALGAILHSHPFKPSTTMASAKSLELVDYLLLKHRDASHAV